MILVRPTRRKIGGFFVQPPEKSLRDGSFYAWKVQQETFRVVGKAENIGRANRMLKFRRIYLARNKDVHQLFATGHFF